MDEFSYELSQQKLFIASLQDDFVGRKIILKQCISTIDKCRAGLLIITGATGTGKSALMVRSLQSESC
jgi:type II secretory ATPase GspE/PulE/Tfp pilus assembly ATPase PilB-like protein